MLKIATKTKKSPEDVLKKAVDFFGPSGLKLEIKEQTDDYVYFQGGGGGVDVTVCTEGKETSVDLNSREWDYQVKEFIAKIK